MQSSQMPNPSIRYLTHDEIDFVRWDRCVNEAFNGTVYAFSWYLEVVSPGWHALVQGDYDSIFPLPVKQKWGIQYIYLPFFCQQLGLISKNKIDTELLTAFVQSIPRSFRWIEVNLNVHNKPDPKIFPFKRNVNYELDLIQPYEQLLSNYSKDHKKNLKIARRSKLTIMKDLTNMEFIQFYEQNLLQHLGDLPHETKYLLLRLIAAAQKHRKGNLFGVYDERNQLVATAFVLYGLGRLILLASASNSDGRKTGAMRHLIDRIIATHSSRNIIFDFEGSNIPSIADFFHGFGAHPTEYPTLRLNRLPIPLRWLKR